MAKGNPQMARESTVMDDHVNLSQDVANPYFGKISSSSLKRALRKAAEEIQKGIVPLSGNLPNSDDANEIGYRLLYIKEAVSSRDIKRFSSHGAGGAAFLTCDFRGRNLHGYNLRNTNFAGSDLKGVVLDGANLEESALENVDARWSNWIRATARKSNISSSVFSGSDLRNADFTDCDLSGVKFIAVNARNAIFTGANLSHCDFTGSDLTGANLSHAFLEETNFSFSHLTNCSFQHTDFGAGNYYGVRIAHNQRPLGWPPDPAPEDRYRLPPKEPIWHWSIVIHRTELIRGVVAH